MVVNGSKSVFQRLNTLFPDFLESNSAYNRYTFDDLDKNVQRLFANKNLTEAVLRKAGVPRRLHEKFFMEWWGLKTSHVSDVRPTTASAEARANAAESSVQRRALGRIPIRIFYQL